MTDTTNQTATDRLNQLKSDINNAVDKLVDDFAKDTGISSSDVYVELSVECYDKKLMARTIAKDHSRMVRYD